MFEAQAWNVGYRDQRYQLDRPARRPAVGVVPLRSDSAVHQPRHAHALRATGAGRVPHRGSHAAGDPGRQARPCATSRTRRSASTCGRCARSARPTWSSTPRATAISIIQVKKHQPGGRDPVWRHASASTTPSSCRCRSNTEPPTSGPRSNGATSAACFASAGTVPASTTTSTASSGTTRFATVPTSRAPRHRAAWRSWPSNSLIYAARHRRHQPAGAQPADRLTWRSARDAAMPICCRSPSTRR